MNHTLLHQVLVAALVVPVGLAETAEQRSVTGAGVRLGDDTWVRCDLAVFPKDRAGATACSVLGPPLLAVEVVSEVSRPVDLGRKKLLYERFGVPSYWVVDVRGDEPEILVFELGDDGRYAEEARAAWGRTCTLTQPFPISLAPDDIFARLPRRIAPRRRIVLADQVTAHDTGPDLPGSEEPILIDAFGRRWPTGAEKVELWDGCPVFYGAWDERDVEIASRAYPGRVVRLDQPPGEVGTMTVLPGPARRPDADERGRDVEEETPARERSSAGPKTGPAVDEAAGSVRRPVQVEAS